jgi:MFS transporter, DHA1 family, inner membrane transport protein
VDVNDRPTEGGKENAAMYCGAGIVSEYGRWQRGWGRFDLGSTFILLAKQEGSSGMKNAKKGLPLVIYAMVIGAFAVGADEFIVAGVVQEISEALSVTIGAVGLFESAYALGVAIGAPLFTALGLRVPRRQMLLISIGVFVLGNVVSAVGPTYWTIMSGRLIAATAHGAFLGIAALYAGELVDPARKGRAIALVFSGLTAATVLGAPLGAAVGRALGWRFTFWSLVLLGAIALVSLLVMMPRKTSANAHGHAETLEPHAVHAGAGVEAHAAHGETHGHEEDDHPAHAAPHGHGDSHAHGGSHGDSDGLDAHARMHMAEEGHSAPLRQQLKAIARPPVWMGLLMTLLGYGGVFTSYVYLAPQITEVAGLSGAWITPLFLLFGLGLFVGNLVGGRLADRSLMPAVLLTVGALVLMLFVMYFAIQNPVTAVIGIFLYGAAAFSVVAPLQLRIVSKAVDAPDVSSAANISAFTLGSAIGIWLGGWAIDGGLGIASVNLVGGAISLSGLALAIVAWAFVDRRYPDPLADGGEIPEEAFGHRH